MTNQTNLDYLFKVTASLPERSAGSSTSTNGRRPAFDDHLLDASASASSSSSSAAVGMGSSDSPPADSAGPASQSHSDDDRAATDEDRLERTEASAHIISPADELHDAAEPSINGSDEEPACDVSTCKGENDSDHNAAEELAAAALIAGQSAADPQREVAIDEPVGETAKSDAGNAESLKSVSPSNFDVSAERSTGDLSIAELAAKEATANPEAEQSTAPTSAGKQAKRSPSTEPVAAASEPPSDSTAERRFDAGRASAEATANIEDAAASAKLNSEKSVTTGRRPARDREKSVDDSGRGASSRITQPADANATQDQATAVAVANGVSPQGAPPVAKTASGDEAHQAAKPIGHATDGLHVAGRPQRAGAIAIGRANLASPDLPRVDAARFVGRVAKAVQTAQERGGLVQLRLSPPELGSLRLELSVQNGVMTAAVETETPAARQILLDHLPALRDRLAEQNIRIERFDVDVRQENAGGQADPRASQQEQRQHQPQQPNARQAAGRPAARQAATGDAPHVPTRLTNSELNLLA